MPRLLSQTYISMWKVPMLYRKYTSETSDMMVFLQDGEGLDLVSSDHTGISQAQRAAGQENFTAIPQVRGLDYCDGDVDDYVDHVIECCVCVHDT